MKEYRHQLKEAADELCKCQILIDEHVKNEEANKVTPNNEYFFFILNGGSLLSAENKQSDEPSRYCHSSRS